MINPEKFFTLLTSDSIELNLNDANKPLLKGMYAEYKGESVYIETNRYNVSDDFVNPVPCVRFLFLEGSKKGKKDIGNVEFLSNVIDPKSLKGWERWRRIIQKLVAQLV